MDKLLIDKYGECQLYNTDTNSLGEVRLHKSSDDSVTEFIQKLSVMCNEIDCFIKHLKTKLIDNETV